MKRLGAFLMLALSLSGAFELAQSEPARSDSRKTQPSERGKPSDEDVPFAEIEKGTTSGITARETYAIRDDAQWLSLWRRHTYGRFPSDPAPHVDFSSEMVVAVFAGETRNTGYSLQIDRIRNAGDKLVVSVSESVPGSGYSKEIGPVNTAEPYDIVRLAQSQLPVVFQGM